MYAVPYPGKRIESDPAVEAVKATPERLSTNGRRSMLIKFTHGLGDAVQLTCVLQHFARHLPDHDIDVAALIGKHSCFNGLCRRVYVLDREPIDEAQYDAVRDLGWYENYSAHEAVPQTKVVNCLRDDFGLPVDLDLLRYSIQVGDEAMARAADYLRRITGSEPPFPVVVLHYQGNTSQDRKDLSHECAKEICDAITEQGYVPVILDWDNRSPLINNRTVFCPTVHQGDIWGATGTGDAETLAALISQAALMIGIDSGPLHVAGATNTPTIGVWTGHHPVQFFDLCPNVLHLVSENWRTIAPCHVEHVAEFFQKNYRFEEYGDVAAAVRWKIRELPRRGLSRVVAKSDPTALVESAGFMVRRENVEQDMVIVRDVFYEDCYRMGIIADRVRRAKLVVDVGAHIGCFARKVHEMNPDARIICIEACPENIPALMANAASFATIIHAACTYETGQMVLWNAYGVDCRSTGGSMVVPADQVRMDGQYNSEPLRSSVTLEDVTGGEPIDLLKLDCEGSEFSILGNTPSLDRIGFIVGEYHGRWRWDKLLRDRFAGWDYGQMSEHGDLGNFHLRNPAHG